MNTYQKLLTGLATITVASLTGCMANPGPPPVEEDPPVTSPSTTTKKEEPSALPARTAVSVGTEPLRNGLNPHVLADNISTVQNLAALVLPSPFWDGVMDTNLLESAEEIDPPADQKDIVQVVRYVITPEAQWSDGTPITGADFTYLFQAMTKSPGVIDDAGYRAIKKIDLSQAGKTVTVSFTQRVENWKKLFQFLLPSHLVSTDPKDFATAFFDDIPAAGGRFLVDSVDRSRGIITLHRNDRYWGVNPASLDIVQLIATTGVTAATDQVRSGQMAFLDVAPEETSQTAFELLPNVQTRVIDGPRQLQIDLNSTSAIMSDQKLRAEFDGLIDTKLVATQAAGRRTTVKVAAYPDRFVSTAEPELLRTATENRPLVIAADPADIQASAAARTIKDLLAQHSIPSTVTSMDMFDATKKGLIDGSVDLIVSHAHISDTRESIASRFACPPDNGAYRTDNLSGYCSEESTKISTAVLSGNMTVDTATRYLDELNAQQHLTIPLLQETRIVVLGDGTVGPKPSLDQWTEGLSTAASWKLKEK